MQIGRTEHGELAGGDWWRLESGFGVAGLSCLEHIGGVERDCDVWLELP